MSDWQNVFTMLGILAVVVVPVLGLHIRELHKEVAELRADLRRVGERIAP
jgi:hypothetical protein